jgi:hypothetical protein
MRFVTAVFALAFTSLLQLPVTAGSACAALRLSEILAGPTQDWDGSGAFSSRDDEWIELVNTGPGALDLSAFFVTDSDSIPRCGLTGTLEPGARRIVFGKEAYDWERATGHPAFGISLGNSGDAVLLWQIAGAETTLADVYAYKSHEAAADRSVARLDNDKWTLFDGLNPYAGTIPPFGNNCAPTPGLPNSCETTPARPSTWGELKRTYR